jgi:hypothetical protein
MPHQIIALPNSKETPGGAHAEEREPITWRKQAIKRYEHTILSHQKQLVEFLLFFTNQIKIFYFKRNMSRNALRIG